MKDRGPRRIGDFLSQILAKYGCGEVTLRKQLEQWWDAVADDRLRSQSKVGSYRRGVLEILVTHPLLVQELASFRRDELLQRIQALSGPKTIRELRFRRS